MHVHWIDHWAYGRSWVHRRDSRVKIAATLLFSLAVLVLPRHDPLPLAVALVGPVALLLGAAVPLRFVGLRVLAVAPFVATLALACLWFEREPAVIVLGPWSWTVSLGLLRAGTVLAKFAVTMTALMALVCTTPFPDLLSGLHRLGLPEVLVVQLGLLYRYLFVLTTTAQKLHRARRLRQRRFLGLGREIRTAGAMVGSLLGRTLTRAERIARAMQSRGFRGRFSPGDRVPLTFGDGLFLAAVLIYTVLLLGVAAPALRGVSP